MCIEFNPQPPLSANANGTIMIANMLNNQDPAWLTQCASALKRDGPCTNGYFSAVVEYSSEDNKEFLNKKEQLIKMIGAAVAEFVNKKCDAVYSHNIKKERSITVDVPKVRKVGIFRKEEYIDHETRVESYVEKESFTYNGWILERLHKEEDYGPGNGCDILNMDYCLGKDGIIYLVLTENGDLDPMVLKCICYSPGFLDNAFSNIYSAAVSGVIGVLDAISIDESDPSRNVHIKLDDDYSFNFPIQIDDMKSYPYGFLDGAIERMIGLLDENGKEKCITKYEWMKPIIYPDTTASKL